MEESSFSAPPISPTTTPQLSYTNGQSAGSTTASTPAPAWVKDLQSKLHKEIEDEYSNFDGDVSRKCLQIIASFFLLFFFVGTDTYNI